LDVRNIFAGSHTERWWRCSYIRFLQDLNCQIWQPRLWPSQRQFIIDWLINWLLQKVESLGEKNLIVNCEVLELGYIQQHLDWFTKSLISSSFNMGLWVGTVVVLVLCAECTYLWMMLYPSWSVWTLVGAKMFAHLLSFSSSSDRCH